MINSIKIIVATILAVLTAQLLKLDFAISAGIVAILSVQPTKKETLNTALARFYAFVVALGISFVCYKFLGFTAQAFFVYIVFFIFICQYFGWFSAMAMDSVLISHFITLNGFGLTEIKNECLLFLIGVSYGILANIFLHKKTDKIEMLKKEADDQIRQILHRMAEKILTLDFADYDGECFKKLDKAIYEAKVFALKNSNNQFRKTDHFDEQYIEMRAQQKAVLFEVYKCIVELKTVPATALHVSAFFEKVSVEYEKSNDVLNLLQELKRIQQNMKEKPLPQVRDEFEDRAILFMILKRMEEFLCIKRDFYVENFGSSNEQLK